MVYQHCNSRKTESGRLKVAMSMVAPFLWPRASHQRSCSFLCMVCQHSVTTTLICTFLSILGVQDGKRSTK